MSYSAKKDYARALADFIIPQSTVFSTTNQSIFGTGPTSSKQFDLLPLTFFNLSGNPDVALTETNLIFQHILASAAVEHPPSATRRRG